MNKQLSNQLINSLSRWERIHIIDHYVKNKVIDFSDGTKSFYDYWHRDQRGGVDDEEQNGQNAQISNHNSESSKHTKSLERFEKRSTPSYADFALGYLKELLKKNNLEFKKNEDFKKSIYYRKCLFIQTKPPKNYPRRPRSLKFT